MLKRQFTFLSKSDTKCRNEETRNILDLIMTKAEYNIDDIEIWSPSIGCSNHESTLFEVCNTTKMETRDIYTENVTLPNLLGKMLIGLVRLKIATLMKCGQQFSQKYDDCVKNCSPTTSQK